MGVPGGAPQSTETHLFRSRDPAALLGSSSLGSAGELEELSSLLSSIDNIIPVGSWCRVIHVKLLTKTIRLITMGYKRDNSNMADIQILAN